MDGMDDTLEKRRVQKGESSVVIGSELDTSLENVDSNENKVELASFQSDSHSLKFDLSGVTQADRGAGNGSANGNKGRIGGLSPFLGPLDEEPTFDNSLTFLSPVRKDDTQRIVNDLEAQLVDETDSQLIGYGLGSVKVVLDTQRIDSQRSGRYEDTQKIHDTQVIGHQISDTQRIRGLKR